ncbi:MAG: hypothetical protein M3Y86_12195 [Verrucomicrobiota bacterium]|nr:hypothetical protein [Verrucomicrobiota bacterium]
MQASSGQTAGVSRSDRFLIGDTNSDAATNSGDALQTRNRSGQPVVASNYRSDVNADGQINSGLRHF